MPQAAESLNVSGKQENTTGRRLLRSRECTLAVIQARGFVRIGSTSSRAVETVSDRLVARRFFISGTVQGVGYRYFAQRAAQRLGVAGYTKNLRDGRVEVYGIGSEKALAELHRELERGPSGASVAGVTQEEASVEPAFENSFSIEYDY